MYIIVADPRKVNTDVSTTVQEHRYRSQIFHRNRNISLSFFLNLQVWISTEYFVDVIENTVVLVQSIFHPYILRSLQTLIVGAKL